MATASFNKLKNVLLRGGRREDNEELDEDNFDTIRRPNSVNLEEYEGTMVGMHITTGKERASGLPGALVDRRDPERLAKAMMGMQARFLDQIGFGERRRVEEKPLPTEEEAGLKNRQDLGSNWSKLALALLAIAGVLAVTTLVLFFEGTDVQHSVTLQKAAAASLESEKNSLIIQMAEQDNAGNCAKFQDVFLSWLSSFCKFVNCSSELCHRYWTPYGGNCYYFSTNVLDWEESRQNCISQGSELLVIRNKKEQRFISGHDMHKVYWIGLTEVPEGGRWKWVDGTELQDELK
ncbi:uncharacterized protein [Scyliorhinus torazame]|uniref:uncharacterized protein n=1 Tax=Scyliorhinus torazame TaxID=75743 RepID=UPI003B595337